MSELDFVDPKRLAVLVSQFSSVLDSGVALRTSTLIQLIEDILDLKFISPHVEETHIKSEKDSKEPSTLLSGKTPDPEDVFSEVEAAGILRMHPDTLRELRKKGTGPVCAKYGGRRYYYKRGDLKSWYAKRIKPSTPS